MAADDVDAVRGGRLQQRHRPALDAGDVGDDRARLQALAQQPGVEVVAGYDRDPAELATTSTPGCCARASPSDVPTRPVPTTATRSVVAGAAVVGTGLV